MPSLEQRGKVHLVMVSELTILLALQTLECFRHQTFMFNPMQTVDVLQSLTGRYIKTKARLKEGLREAEGRQRSEDESGHRVFTMLLTTSE